MFKSGRPYAGEAGSPVLLYPIINAQNRNEARIPVFTRQGRPTEIVSLYAHFWFVYTEDRAHWHPVIRNMSQRYFQLLKGEFSEARWCIFSEGRLISMKTVTGETR